MLIGHKEFREEGKLYRSQSHVVNANNNIQCEKKNKMDSREINWYRRKDSSKVSEIRRRGDIKISANWKRSKLHLMYWTQEDLLNSVILILSIILTEKIMYFLSMNLFLLNNLYINRKSFLVSKLDFPKSQFIFIFILYFSYNLL